MTNEEIRIKVAEAMGWKPPFNEREWLYNSGSEGEDVYGKFVGTDPCGDREQVPNYPFDLNACAEFEAELKKLRVFSSYLSNLALICGFNAQGNEAWFKLHAGLEAVCSATARQRCLAYLKTKGIIP